MSRDGERLVEMVTLIAVAFTLALGPAQQNISSTERNSSIHSSRSEIAISDRLTEESGHSRTIHRAWKREQSAPKQPEVKYVSGLLELDRLLFARPLKSVEEAGIRQSC